MCLGGDADPKKMESHKEETHKDTKKIKVAADTLAK